VQPASLEFVSIQAEPMSEDIPHNGNFFLGCISGHGAEYDFFL
jgi:hypothetical protein